MYGILIYIIKWAICLSVLYVPFALLMRKETFTSFNRILLLCTITISAMLPLIEIEIPIEVERQVQEKVNAAAFAGITSTTVNSIKSDSGINLWQVIFAIYLTGVIVSAARILINIIKIRRAIYRGTLWKEECERYTLHCHANRIAPFSWFNNIVISQEDYNNSKEIILHEEGHIIGRHSWDILLTSILTPLQWFNPFLYMLINDLKDIHEYEADKYVLQHNSDAQAYQMLILRKSIGDNRFTLANNFVRNSVRKRVEMMIRKKSGNIKRLKGVYIVPAAMLSTLFFAKPLYIYSNVEKEKSITVKEIDVVTDTVKIEKVIRHPIVERTVKKSERKTETGTDRIKESAKYIEKEAIEDTLLTDEQHVKKSTITEKRIIYKSYSDNVILDDAITDTSCDKYRCAVVMEFSIDCEGIISDCTAKGCNVSIEGYQGYDRSGTISQLREYAIATATDFINENSDRFTCDDDIITHYTANLILSNKKEENCNAENVLWIGTTPIK